MADELADWAKENGPARQRPFKIHLLHLGADGDNLTPTRALPPDADIVFDCLRARPTFLMVGMLEPCKGHGQVLDAFEQLWRTSSDLNLVIIGKQGWMVEALLDRLRAHPELNQRLLWLEGISDEYLEKVYTASTCLIAGSYGEGFGLPLIVAAQHKLPIIARDIRAFREVAGEYAYYFDGPTPDVLVDAINAWLVLHRSGRHPMSDNIPWLTWKERPLRLAQVLQDDRL
ncbi:MAG: glycosyltransferase [Chromatiaceae bacterium]|nr:glycosyltransferase [Chromatiaceae bacterium]